MRTKLPVEELLRLAQHGAEQGHYGTFMARARELGSKLEDEAYKDGYTTGLKDKVTADKTQHKPVLESVRDDYTPLGLYNMLTRALNDGYWDANEVLTNIHEWLAEQNSRNMTLSGILREIQHGQAAAKQLQPAEE